jgi:hypothetical protein
MWSRHCDVITMTSLLAFSDVINPSETLYCKAQNPKLYVFSVEITSPWRHTDDVITSLWRHHCDVITLSYLIMTSFYPCYPGMTSLPQPLSCLWCQNLNKSSVYDELLFAMMTSLPSYDVMFMTFKSCLWRNFLRIDDVITLLWRHQLRKTRFSAFPKKNFFFFFVFRRWRHSYDVTVTSSCAMTSRSRCRCAF